MSTLLQSPSKLCSCGNRITNTTSRTVTVVCKCGIEHEVPANPNKVIHKPVMSPQQNIEALAHHWNLIHTYDLDPWDISRAIEYYKTWYDNIPCAECQQHWKQATKYDPVDFRSSDDFFKYFVRKHNEINDKLNHNFFPLYTAYNIYRPNMSPACIHRSKPIGTVSCGCASAAKVYNCNLYNIHCILEGSKTRNVEYDDGTKSDTFEGITCQGCYGYSPLLADQTDEWRFVKTEHLIQATRALATKLELPSAVIAMPTSGLIPATYLSIILNVPMYASLDEYINKRQLHVSHRSKHRVGGYGRPILIDDTVFAGNSFIRAETTIQSLPENERPLRCAVYALPSARHKVDVWGELLHCPHILEWNMFNSGIINGTYRNANLKGGSAVDFDGVLCHDPPTVYDERIEKRVEKYEQWINDAVPRYPVRNRKIPLIVTWRIEKYRQQTEAWLAKHNIEYEKLVMWPGDAVSRTFKPDYKGEAYKNSSCSIFIESNAVQARQIFEYTNKPVLCLATGKIHK